MENTLKFKTNINCSGCVAKVTPLLNNKEEIEKWEVDINDPNKILTIEGENINAQEIVDTVQKSGFRIEFIDQ